MQPDEKKPVLEIHPAANIFPLMEEDEYEKLKEDISGIGLTDPIVLLQGKIIDGRHRYRACMELGIEPVFAEFPYGMSDTSYVMSKNLYRRHLNPSQRAMVAAKAMEYHSERAKRRQREAGAKNIEDWNEEQGRLVTAPVRELDDDNVIEFPGEHGTAAGTAAKDVGVGERSVESAAFVLGEGTEEDIDEIESGKATVKAKERELRERKKAEVEKPKNWVTLEQWKNLAPQAREILLATNVKAKFNTQKSDKIEWAQWSWNPVTGCKHDCAYCYARDIAEKIYQQGFVPSLIPERLSAPANTKVPKNAEGVDRNVFTCSMADLFGKWVPREWIEAVLTSIREAPQWNFLLLTKFPQRLLDFSFPDNAWVGATVDRQLKIAKTEKIFERVDAKTRFISIEPMLEDLRFTRLDLFNWIIVGGSSKSKRTPEWVPPFDWIASIHRQSREAGCSLYFKTNLKLPDELRLVELPWVEKTEKTLPEEFR